MVMDKNKLTNLHNHMHNSRRSHMTTHDTMNKNNNTQTQKIMDSHRLNRMHNHMVMKYSYDE